MCGIVGYVGEKTASRILLDGLKRLEYRGYDSSGLAVMDGASVGLRRSVGKISNLEGVLKKNPLPGSVGLGHTRWATHGVPSEENAHPHQSTSGRFTLVHNGVIENYAILKREYLQDVTFKSETDTEVIVQLIEKIAAEGLDVEEAFRKTVSLLHGSYALALVDNKDKNTIYVAKNKSPLLVGVGEGFNVVASDAMAMLQVTDQYVELMDKETVIVTKEGVTIKTLDGEVVERAPYTA